MFKNNSRYQIITNCILSRDNTQIITKYYQPFIGPIATLIYLNLINDIEGKKQTDLFVISRIQTYINTSLDKLFLGVQVLSKVGLINIYKSNIEEEYIFELKNTKQSYDFFADVNLTKMLQQNVSEEMFTELALEVKDIPFKLNGYNKLHSEYRTLTTTKVQDSYSSNNSSKDDERYRNYFDSLGNTNSYAETTELINICSINKLTKVEIETILPLAIDGKKIDVAKFIKGLSILRDQPQVDKERISSKEDALRAFETYDSELFLMKVNNGRVLSKYERDLISTLRNGYKLTDPVINVLIDYVLLINNKNLNRAFVETIAASWSRMNFETSQQAMQFVIEYNKQRKEKKAPTANIMPDWLETNDSPYDSTQSKERLSVDMDDIFAGFESH